MGDAANPHMGVPFQQSFPAYGAAALPFRTLGFGMENLNALDAQ